MRLVLATCACFLFGSFTANATEKTLPKVPVMQKANKKVRRQAIKTRRTTLAATKAQTRVPSLQKACAVDRKKLCAPGRSKAKQNFACLSKQKKLLSPGCKAALLRAKKSRKNLRREPRKL